MSKFFRIAIRSLASLAGFLILLILLINLPFSRNFVTGRVNALFQKLELPLHIDRINSIRLQKFAVEGFSLVDPSGDTVIYAHLVKADIKLAALRKSKLILDEAELSGVGVHLQMNYQTRNYTIAESFPKKEKKKQADPEEKKSSWEIRLKKGGVSSLRFSMEDSLSGIFIEQKVDFTEIRRFKLALLEKELSARSLELSQAKGNIRLLPGLKEKKETAKQTAIPWNYGIGDLALEGFEFTFENVSDSLWLNLVLDKGILGSKKMDIPGKSIDLDELTLEGARVGILSGLKSTSPKDSGEPAKGDFPWNIKSKSLSLKNAGLSSGRYAARPSESLFDGIGMEDLEMKVRDFQISQAHTGMDLKKLNLSLSNGFILKELKAQLESEGESTRLNLDLETANSQIRMDGEASDGFFNLLKDPAGISKAHLSLYSSTLSVLDLSTFISPLKDLPVYTQLNAAAINLGVHLDKVNEKISISEFSLVQETHFNLSLNGWIAQFSSPRDAYGDIGLNLNQLDLPWLTQLLSGFGVHIQLPDTRDLVLSASISDKFRAPDLKVRLNSQLGQLELAGELNFKEKSYRVHSEIGQLQLGEILGVDELGSLTGRAEMEGSGYTGQTMEAKVKVAIDSVDYMEYSYTLIDLEAMLRPGEYGFTLLTGDPSFTSSLTGSISRSDSLLSANAQGSLSAQLDRLHFFSDNLAINTDISATLVKGANTLETQIQLDGIDLISPEKSASLQQLSALFRADTTRTSLNAQGDFMDIDLQVDRTIGELGSLGESYGNYLKSFVDSSRSNAEKRVAELPRIIANGQITNHEVLDLFLQDSGFHMSTLHFSIINEPSKSQINYLVNGTDMAYKSVKAGTLDIVLTDSAGALTLDAMADQSSLFSGPPSRLQLKGQSVSRQIQLDVSLFDHQQDSIYHFAIESKIDSSRMFIQMPSQQLILGYQQWQLDSPEVLQFDLISKRVWPDIRMRTDSSYLHFGTLGKEGDPAYKLTLNQVKIASLWWEELMVEKPEGSITGTLQLIHKDSTEKKITTELTIQDARYADLAFDSIQITGFLASNHSGDLSTEISARLDSATFDLTGENVLSENRHIDAEFSDIPLNTLQPFTKKYLSDLSGNISGIINASTASGKEKFNGNLMFHGARLKIIPLNSIFIIPDQAIKFDNDRLVLSNFRVQDTLKKALLVDGFIDFRTQQLITDLDISSSSIQVMNTTKEDNETFYGSIFVDSKISFKGPVSKPNINARILLAEGTKLNISSSESVDLSESAEIVNFTSFSEEEEQITFTPIVHQSRFNTTSLETSIEIDPSTQVNFNLLKRIFNIKLQIQGGGLFNYNMLNNNQVSLSGRYEISKGSALLDILGWPNKNFNISPGGYANWDGNVSNPELKFEATNKVSTSYVNPVDGRLRNVDIIVVLQLANHLSNLDVLFTIRTEDNYLMRIINTLSPEEQMRQAVTILLFETIDLPGISSSTNYMTQQVNSILSSQLNQLTKSTIKGVDISFGIDSYTQPNTGGGERTTTSLSYEVKKSLLNNRAKIEVSGRLNNPNEAPGAPDQSLNNLSFEYQLDSAETKFLKVYNEHTYEDVFEGQVIKTGVGFTYRKPYKSIRDIWKRKKKTSQVKRTQKPKTDR